MNDQSLHKPTITYVTDENLDADEHKRILRAFLACAENHTLRVAFRIPSWTDTEVDHLVNWSLHLADDLGVSDRLLPALIHDRPEVAQGYSEAGLWLPWRNRDLEIPETIGNVVLSVHSPMECAEATALGASEVIFGHVFTSETHPGEPGRGVAALQALSAGTPEAKITAIGGINPHTIAELGAIQFERVAAMRVISRAENISETLRLMEDAWCAASVASDPGANQRFPFGHPANIFF